MKTLLLSIFVLLPMMVWSMAETPPTHFVVAKDEFPMEQFSDVAQMKARLGYLISRHKKLMEIDSIIRRDNAGVKLNITPPNEKNAEAYYSYILKKQRFIYIEIHIASLNVVDDNIVGFECNIGSR